MKTTTLFEKIIRGEIPCYKVYEDDFVFSFLDLYPVSWGHTLVVPKEPARWMHELSEVSAAALGRVLPKLCRAVMEATGVEDYNILQNNGKAAHQAVFHVHVHIIPKPSDHTKGGLGILWPAQTLNPLDAEGLALKILAGIKEI